MPDEDTGVPIELVAFDEHFGKFSGRLLNESLNLVESAFFLFVNLDVSISRFRVSRLDTDVYQFSDLEAKSSPFSMASLNASGLMIRLSDGATIMVAFGLMFMRTWAA